MRIFYVNKRLGRLLCLAAGLVLAFFVVWQFAQAHWLSQAMAGHKLLPIYEVDTQLPAVAFSFDASWGAEYTEHILDICDAYQFKTTFFLVNIWLEQYPEMAKQIAARGHEIGLHSASHPHFSQLSPSQMTEELAENAALIEEITGCRPALFRPPYGDYNDSVIQTVNACGYVPVQWSVDSLDWQDLSAEQICRRVTEKLSAGDIVLFHNNGLHTAEALPVIVEYALSRGLRIVPVGELLLQ
nr:polysaccharide deacetylase family protein [Bacillota bacterium]